MSVWWRHNLGLERQSHTCAFVFEHRSKLTRLSGSVFTGKVGSDLGKEKPITLIRWTTQFVRVRRISDLYNPT